MVFELEGLKILLAHGHEYRVKYNYISIEERGKLLGCDIVIFGHTHIQYLFSKMELHYLIQELYMGENMVYWK